MREIELHMRDYAEWIRARPSYSAIMVIDAGGVKAWLGAGSSYNDHARLAYVEVEPLGLRIYGCENLRARCDAARQTVPKDHWGRRIGSPSPTELASLVQDAFQMWLAENSVLALLGKFAQAAAAVEDDAFKDGDRHARRSLATWLTGGYDNFPVFENYDLKRG